MPNKSQIRDPRWWKKQRDAGNVETIEAAYARQEAQEAARQTPEPEPPKLTFTTVTEAARALGVNPSTVRRRLYRGTYAGERVDGAWVITDEAVLEAVTTACAS